MTDFTRTAFIFPGQGSQIVGMGKDIADAYPIAREIFLQADDLIGFGLSKLMFDGPEDELSDTAITQPAMYVCSIAILRALQAELPGVQPAYAAGHSLGELTALTATDALSFEDGVNLVRERGRLMKEAGARTPGGMAAILGMDADLVEQIVVEASNQTGRPVVIANDNCPGQIVISGDNTALDAAVNIAKEKGARRVLPLAVSVATHSPLMAPAKEMFSQLVRATTFQKPLVPVIANVSAKPLTSPDEIRSELEAQVTSSVRWTQSMQFMISAGIETYIEIGSKDVLTGLLRRIDRTKQGINISDLASLQEFIQSHR